MDVERTIKRIVQPLGSPSRGLALRYVARRVPHEIKALAAAHRPIDPAGDFLNITERGGPPTGMAMSWVALGVWCGSGNVKTNSGGLRGYPALVRRGIKAKPPRIARPPTGLAIWCRWVLRLDNGCRAHHKVHRSAVRIAIPRSGDARLSLGANENRRTRRSTRCVGNFSGLTSRTAASILLGHRSG